MTTQEKASQTRGAWLQRLAPGLWRLTHYRASDLPGDLTAGITMGVVMVPLGLAFGLLAGLPMAGLYASVFPLVAYAIFSGSKLLVISPDASMSALIAASIAPLAVGTGEAGYAQMVAVTTLMMAIICAVGALCRVGFIASLLAKPVIVGFLHGTAVVIVLGQIPQALGIEIEAGELWSTVQQIARGAKDTNLIDLAIATGSLVIILACRRWLPRIPGQLLVLLLASVAVVAFDLAQQGVKTVGLVPAGMPRFTRPAFDAAMLRELLPVALAVALVAFSDVMVMARAFAVRQGTKVDPNQELMALGLSNLASGFTQGLPVGGSSSRTAMAESSGGKSSLTLLVAAATVLLILAFLTPLLRPLPLSALAGILFAAAWSLCDFAEMIRLWRFRGVGLFVALATMLGVIVLGMLPGILIGVGLCIVLLVKYLSTPEDALLGRVPDTTEYHDLKLDARAQAVPGVMIYRFSGPLFFANSARFTTRVEELALEEPGRYRSVILDASGITLIDLTAIEALVTLARDLAARDISLGIAGAIEWLRESLQRGGVLPELRGGLHATVAAAVAATQGPASP